MSVRHVRDYYNQVASQYHDMINELKDFEELAMQEMFDPGRLEQIKQSIQPLLRNYEVLSYIIFLLNKPNRKSKVKRYDKQYGKSIDKLPHSATMNGVLETNNRVIDELKRA